MTKKERKDLDDARELAAHWADLFLDAERKQRAERTLSDALANALRVVAPLERGFGRDLAIQALSAYDSARKER